MPNPQMVGCPDCAAPPGEDCTTTYDDHHPGRVRAAELRAVTHGTCALCGHPMVAGTVGGVFDAWHPDPQDAAACPVLPDPTRQWNEYATALNLGLSAGHPGIEHFTPQEVQP